MGDRAFDFSNRPGLVGSAAHHAVMDIVAQQSPLLTYLHEQGLIRWSDYNFDGVPVATSPANAISAVQAQHVSGHNALSDFQIEHFQVRDVAWLNRATALAQTGLSPAEARLAAAKEYLPEVRGDVESFRTRVNPLVNFSGSVLPDVSPFVDFSNRSLSLAEVRSGGWYTPLSNSDPLLNKYWPGMTAAEYYAGASTSGWSALPDHQWGSRGISFVYATVGVTGTVTNSAHLSVIVGYSTIR